VECAFRDGVLDLARHRLLVDARGHEDDAAGVTVELRGELFDEEQRRADVLGEERVEVRRRRVRESPTPAARMIDDEHVERPAEVSACRVDDTERCVSL
jgi:hypothetical protein